MGVGEEWQRSRGEGGAEGSRAFGRAGKRASELQGLRDGVAGKVEIQMEILTEPDQYHIGE